MKTKRIPETEQEDRERINSEGYPSGWKLRLGISVNVIATSIGMFSLGLLAMLITHHNLKERGSSSVFIAIADIISFFTAILGKIAIMLFFNHPIFVKHFQQIYKNGLRGLFKIQKKSVLDYVGWSLNYILSLNASLFWAGLVQISFMKSADILDEIGSDAPRNAANQIRQWYVFILFVLCSFYANWISWPSIHQSGYQQAKGVVRWLLEAKTYRQLKESLEFRINSAHNETIRELKQYIKESEFVESPRLDALVSFLLEDENKSMAWANYSANDKATYVINRVGNGNLQKLRQAYLGSYPMTSNKPNTMEWFIRHGIALGFMGASIWGFHNILDLNDVIWNQWGLSSISTYGGRYAAFFSISVIIYLTVYPMIYRLSGIVKQGIPSHVFSKPTFCFILLIAGFVAIFGGLANGEQSALANESVGNIILSAVASSLVDMFGLYMVLGSFFEHRIIESKKIDNKILLKQGYMKFKSLGSAASQIDRISEEELFELVENQQKINSVVFKNQTVGTERQQLLGGKTRMFCCFETYLRRIFNVESSESETFTDHAARSEI